MTGPIHRRATWTSISLTLAVGWREIRSEMVTNGRAQTEDLLDRVEALHPLLRAHEHQAERENDFLRRSPKRCVTPGSSACSAPRPEAGWTSTRWAPIASGKHWLESTALAPGSLRSRTAHGPPDAGAPRPFW